MSKTKCGEKEENVFLLLEDLILQKKVEKTRLESEIASCEAVLVDLRDKARCRTRVPADQVEMGLGPKQGRPRSPRSTRSRLRQAFLTRPKHAFHWREAQRFVPDAPLSSIRNQLSVLSRDSSSGIIRIRKGFYQAGSREGHKDGRSLFKRHHEVLVGLADGLSYSAIANKMGVSRDAVRSYIRKIKRKSRASRER